MKRLCIVSFILFLFDLLYAGSFDVSLPLKEVSVSREGGFAEFDAFLMRELPGNPAIPRPYLATFVLPDGIDISTVKASFSDLNETELSGEWNVEPIIPDPMNGESYPVGAIIIDGKNIEIYSSDSFYPSDYKGELFIGKQRTVNIATVEIYPYRYNPITKKLRKIASATLTLEYTSSNGTLVEIPVSKLGKKMLFDTLSKAVNLGDISLTNEDNTFVPYTILRDVSPENYVILTTNHIYENSKGIMRFIRSKTERGFNVLVVTENKMRGDGIIINYNGWGGGTGDVAAENIRKWLHDNYLILPIEYLLLVGNPDPESGDVPMKKTWLYRYTDNTDNYGIDEMDIRRFYPTDYYYAELTSDWDSNKDGNYGVGSNGPEGTDDTTTVDKYAELLVGRFPFYNENFDNLDSLFRRAIVYENTVKDSAEYRKNIFLAMPMLGGDWSGHGAGENVVTKVLTNHGYTANRNNNIEPWYYRVYNNTPYEVKKRKDLEKWCNGDYDIPNSRTCKGDIQQDDDGEYCSCIQQAPEDETSFDLLFNHTDQDCTMDSVRDIVINHNPGIFFWHTHGGRINAGYVLDISNAKQNFNDRERNLMIGFQASCNNAWPDTDALTNTVEREYNLAYTFILTGAITTIASTRISNTGVNDTATEYFEELIINKNSIGFSWYNALPDVWPGYTNAFAYNIYGDPSFGIDTFYDESDSDDDGIRDSFDNCPHILNTDQADRDGDGIGDICDNCIGNNNPEKDYDLNSELISGETGAIANNLGHLGTKMVGFTWKFVYKMQPDSDLDGIGDACDHTSAGGNGFTNSKITNVKAQSPSFKDSFPMLERKYAQYAKVNLTMPAGSGRESGICNDLNIFSLYLGSTCNSAVHYCAITHEENEQSLWGQPGFCTTSGNSNNIFNYGFSHGSDDFDRNSILSWQSRISVADNSVATNFSNWSAFTTDPNPNMDSARKPIVNSNSSFKLTGSENGTIWNWRRDWYEKSNCNDPEYYETPKCQSLRLAADYSEAYTMYYTLSTSILPVSGTVNVSQIPSYIAGTGENISINSAYFPATNQNKNAKAARYSIPAMQLNYYRKTMNIPIPEVIEIPEIEFCPSCYWDIPLKDIIGENGLPEASSYESIGRWFIGKDENGNYLMSAQRIQFHPETEILSDISEREMVAVVSIENPATGISEYQLMLNTSESGADWTMLGRITGWNEEIQAVKAIVSAESGLYFIGRTEQSGQHFFKISTDSQPVDVVDPEDIPEITYTLHDLGATGTNEDMFDTVKLVSAGNGLFLIGKDSAGARTRTFKMTNGNPVFTEITGTAPAQRNIYNLKASGKYIFLTGGENANNGTMNDLWRFDTENEIWEQIPVQLNGDFRKVISQVVDGKLVMANPVIDGNTTHPAFEIDPAIEDLEDLAASVNNISIPVTVVEYEGTGDYCLNETDDILKGGLQGSDSCIPFTHPWYKQFSTGSTVYSVAGKGDRLYVGTSSSIKVYDISDPAAMTLKYTFSTNSRVVYDLEVADGDIMYAATSKGLYKLSTANPDSLSVIGSFYSTGSYNYQYKIQLYNGKLYVGDDNGINIRNKDTFARLAYVNIGSVLDFAIANGEIASYWSAFWDEGIQIRGVDALNMKAYDYATCYTGELATDHGAFYLSCDDYEYRFAGLPNTYLDYFPVDGDIREMQENYAYNGWAYIPDGSFVKQSTSNDVPAVCGNGITEPGELCDGNSVECTTLDPDYTGGSAACNSTCNGYNEANCETDGW